MRRGGKSRRGAGEAELGLNPALPDLSAQNVFTNPTDMLGTHLSMKRRLRDSLIPQVRIATPTSACILLVMERSLLSQAALLDGTGLAMRTSFVPPREAWLPVLLSGAMWTQSGTCVPLTPCGPFCIHGDPYRKDWTLKM